MGEAAEEGVSQSEFELLPVVVGVALWAGDKPSESHIEPDGTPWCIGEYKGRRVRCREFSATELPGWVRVYWLLSGERIDFWAHPSDVGNHPIWSKA